MRAARLGQYPAHPGGRRAGGVRVIQSFKILRWRRRSVDEEAVPAGLPRPPAPPPAPPAGPAPSSPGDDVPPMLLLPSRRKALIMGAAMLSMFLAALDQTVMSVAMPRIVADLGGLDLFAWPFTSYMLTSTVSVPIVGKLSDIRGRKPILLAGILVFLLGSVLSGTADSMTTLIAFRALQGVGAGLINAMAFTLIGDLFMPRERGRWMGLFAGTFAVASVVGPLAGGTITDNLSWRWVFYLNVPVVLIALPVVLIFIPSYTQQRKVRLDWRGGLLLAAAATPLLLAFSWAGSQYGWGDFPVLVSLAIAAAALALFIWNETRVEEPIFPLGLFRNRAYAVALTVTGLTGLAMFGALQFVPLFVQGAQGASATNSGMVTMPMMGGVVIGSIFAGQMVHRTGRYRLPAIAGSAVMTVGMYLLSTLDAGSSQNVARLYMALLGLGVGTSMPLHSIIVQNAIPQRLLGVGTASVQFFRQIGGTMGIAIFGAVLISTFAAGLEANDVPGSDLLAERPQILLDPEALDAFRAEVDAESPGASVAAVAAAREALADSTGKIFLIATIIGVVSTIVVLALPQIHMRGREEMVAEVNGRSGVQEGDLEATEPQRAPPVRPRRDE